MFKITAQMQNSVWHGVGNGIEYSFHTDKWCSGTKTRCYKWLCKQNL